MADNAPFSVNRPPFPNVVVGFNQRVDVHVATLDLDATPTLDATKSTAGITVTDTDVGRITVTFPAGGTGAFGWVVQSLVSLATPTGQVSIDLDADLTNYATGTLEISLFDEDGTSGIATAADVTGSVTLLIYVVKAVV